MVDSFLQVPEIEDMAKVSSAGTGGSWIIESNPTYNKDAMHGSQNPIDSK